MFCVKYIVLAIPRGSSDCRYLREYETRADAEAFVVKTAEHPLYTYYVVKASRFISD